MIVVMLTPRIWLISNSRSNGCALCLHMLHIAFDDRLNFRANGAGANITKPCNWRSVNEAKQQAKYLEMRGQKLVIRLIREWERKAKSL